MSPLIPSGAAGLEQLCREDESLIERLSLVNRRRDAGIQTSGEMWRWHQVGIPSVEEVTDFLVGKLPQDQSNDLPFRMEVLIDIDIDIGVGRSGQCAEQAKSRREIYFQKSAELLSKK